MHYIYRTIITMNKQYILFQVANLQSEVKQLNAQRIKQDEDLHQLNETLSQRQSQLNQKSQQFQDLETTIHQKEIESERIHGQKIAADNSLRLAEDSLQQTQKKLIETETKVLKHQAEVPLNKITK